MKRTCYIHIPFCLKKCLFCSFTVAIGAKHHMNNYVDALIKEIKNVPKDKINHVYLGGGTPGFLDDYLLSHLMQTLRSHFYINDDAQVTIETNPENVTLEKARTFKNLGFNRISLGAQTFNEVYLKWLGRAHNREKIVSAVQILKDVGFDNLNIDLMIGFPSQTIEQIQDDLKQVIALNPKHISVYTLTVEPNSRFFATQLKLDNDEIIANQYQYVCDYLNGEGLMQYEVSNFAFQGFESLHNMHYWLGGEYYGFGVGAHGYVDGKRFWHGDKLMEYIQNPIEIAGYEEIDVRTAQSEQLVFGLRMNKGIDIKMITVEKREICQQLVDAGLLEEVSGMLKTTSQGRLLLDEIATRLL